MNIFEIIISPFVFIIEKLFLSAYGITHNYGWAIILLSFSISLLLLPVFVFIEKAKKKDDALKSKMQPFIDEIKRCYKGQERYYYLKTLNRQYHYNTLKALIPILSLLIQIPFFIAAYQFLEFYEPLAGTSFLFIDDLSAPDGLWGHINVLPIVMTLVNLVTAYFYTRNGNTDERKQMIVVAGLFLILLFNLPSGLVLYWTMNNVFSFLRLFITNPEVFKKQSAKKLVLRTAFQNFKTRIKITVPKLVPTFWIAVLLVAVYKLNLLATFNLEAIFTAISLSFLIGLGITVFIGFLAGIHKTKPLISDKRISIQVKHIWPNFKATFLTLLSLMVASQVNWALLYYWDDFIQRFVFALIGSSVLTIIVAVVVLFYQGRFDELLRGFTFNIKRLSRKYRIGFIISLALVIIAQFGWAYFNGFSNIIVSIALSVFVLWLFFISVYNANEYLKSNNINSFTTILSKVTLSPKLYFSLVFLSVYFVSATRFYYTGYNNVLAFCAIVFTAIAQLLGSLYYYRIYKTVNQFQLIASSILLFSLVLLQIIFVLELALDFDFLFATFNIQNQFSIPSLSNILLAGILFTLTTVPFYLNYKKFKIEPLVPKIIWPYALALFYILGLIFFWSPLIVYASFPEIFSFAPFQVLVRNFPLFAIVYASGIALFFILPKGFKVILTTIFLVLTLTFFINSFIIPLNVGSLQLGEYIKEQNLAVQPYIYLVEGLFLIVSFLWLKRILMGKHSKRISLVLVVLTVILIGQSIITSGSGGDFFRKNVKISHLPNTISFSKKKENIIYFIPDMFMGMHMKYILEESPELKEVFEGFIWYPNTLSVSTNTCPSISSLLAGEDYNLDKLNTDRRHTMNEKITMASELFTEKVKSYGYKLTSTQMVYSEIDKTKFDAYLPSWHTDWNKWNDSLNIGGTKELDFTILWKNALFYGVPLFIKPRIYNYGKWIRVDDETNKNTERSQRCNFIRLLPLISDTLNTDKSFIYIHSEATHGPWNIVDDNGNLEMDVSSYKNQRWFMHSFAKWIKWMKENGVYDNTKIIMLADHSHYLPDDEVNEFGGTYRWNKEGQKKLSAQDFWRVNSLLMVKDFKAKGKLKEDWRFMTNTDAPAITFDENNPTKTENPKSRTLPVFFVDFSHRLGSKTKLEITKQFTVTDSVYNPDNWQEIKQ